MSAAPTGGLDELTDPLEADCSACFSLCCVGTTFTRSAEFAFSKAKDVPCRHLEEGPTSPRLGCGIHGALRDRGMAGCVSFDCLGAGQRASADWTRDHGAGSPHTSALFQHFRDLVRVHVALWHVRAAGEHLDAAGHPEPGLRDRITEAYAALELRSTTPAAPPVAEIALDPLLREVSEALRPSRPSPRAGLTGRSARGAELRDVSLVGALLLGAQLQGCDLRGADLRGADLRAADLKGADLRGALFLRDSQLRAALGDRATQLPDRNRRPEHWG